MRTWTRSADRAATPLVDTLRVASCGSSATPSRMVASGGSSRVDRRRASRSGKRCLGRRRSWRTSTASESSRSSPPTRSAPAWSSCEPTWPSVHDDRGGTYGGQGPTDDRRLSPSSLVEDDEGLRPHPRARTCGARATLVTEAASAEEASAALLAGLRPALVLLDVNLPGETGWDLLRVPRHRRPPVRRRSSIASAVTVSPRRLRRVRRRRLPAQAIPPRDACCRPSSACSPRQPEGVADADD